MKTIRCSRYFTPTVLTVIFSLVFTIFMYEFSYSAEKIEIKSGTPVQLKLMETVSSKTHVQGKNVNVITSSDVIVNGKTVIRAGTPAIATVTYCNKAGIVGEPGTIEIQVESVTAVDGTSIMLASNAIRNEGESTQGTAIALTIILCFLFLFMKGKEAVIPSGKNITAYTAGSYQVEVNK
ncbi:MAG: hypothetical protein N2450_09755 [bacterium]|nr:hypothetical protein [bacterium]